MWRRDGGDPIPLRHDVGARGDSRSWRMGMRRFWQKLGERRAGNCSQLLQHAKRIGIDPLLSDMVIDHAMEIDRADADFLARRRNPHEFPAMRAVNDDAGGDELTFGDLIQDLMLYVGKRSEKSLEEASGALTVEYRHAVEVKVVIRGKEPGKRGEIPGIDCRKVAVDEVLVGFGRHDDLLRGGKNGQPMTKKGP
jgi:hypothetical protein